jgi:hypothetical protein
MYMGVFTPGADALLTDTFLFKEAFLLGIFEGVFTSSHLELVYSLQPHLNKESLLLSKMSEGIITPYMQ